MTEFDPERFENKYEHYFPELQTAYRNAFERMSDSYDSELIHAIDQQILNESEPFYDPNSAASGDNDAGQFRLELPANPADRVTGIVVADAKLREVLDIYVETVETELHAVFDVDRPDDRHDGDDDDRHDGDQPDTVEE